MIEINYSTMKITVILLALSLLCLFSCKDKKVKEELTTQKVEVVEVAKPEPVAPPKEEPKPVVKQVNYYLVAGCFKIPENAERLQAKLIQEGYDSRIVPFYNMSMVTYDGYGTSGSEPDCERTRKRTDLGISCQINRAYNSIPVKTRSA